ncbi:guanylate kinase [Paenibacillus senegalimassiliensis]|uniref:guanylate kinase n=1 Tax=Paenibacillus senegalimassiliensis TaxID=1737426 RepID=UPI00073E912D|nr:guanylate kinase [Paenibacillus senegalimassiliensis]
MWKWLKSSKSSPAPAAVENPDTEQNKVIKDQPKVIIITGTSGSGRKSIASQLSAELNIPYVRPYTTRRIRQGEVSGEHYRFISPEEFQSIEGGAGFSQSVRLERGSYGIPERDLMEALTSHQAAIVVMNHDGVQVFRKRFGSQAVRIFLYVTKDDIRLRGEREGAPHEVTEEYLRNYSEQVVHKKDSDYLLQNIDPANTLVKIKQFLQPIL